MTMKKSLWKTTLRALRCLLVGGAVGATGACGGVVEVPTDAPTDVPFCIAQLIDDAKAGSVGGEDPAAVTEFEYQGKLVYLLAPHCCDQFEDVLDTGCKRICAPGGLLGRG